MNEIPLESLVFTLASLREGYRSRTFEVGDVIRETLRRIEAADQPVFLHIPDIRALLDEAKRQQDLILAHENPWSLRPLLGIPFAVKDNIDVASMPTTAACPALAYTPEQSAACVASLQKAGGLCVGKTNMDQLATGLVGVRSPFGACHNAFDARFIAGGSSSGSGLAVSLGLCCLALGSDTAGSGRVPAALGNTVGLKPTRGLISVRGLLPACPSLDCISIFALSAEDASEALAVTAAHDIQDPWSRPIPADSRGPHKRDWKELRLGIPRAGQLDFSGNDNYAVLFAAAMEYAQGLGAGRLHLDIGPLLEAAKLLYQGPWIAERYASIAERISPASPDLLPVIREVLAPAEKRAATEVFSGLHRLQALRRASESLFEACDVLMLPTLPTVYTVEAIHAEPVALNAVLGRFTNFVNLLDLSAVALPAGFDTYGLPFGVTLIAPAFHDESLLHLAAAWQNASGLGVGSGLWRLPEQKVRPGVLAAPPPLSNFQDTVSHQIPLLVFGLHMHGQPLEHEITGLGGVWVGEAHTAPGYAMRLMVKGDRRFPAVYREASAAGGLRGEIWEMPGTALGGFLLRIKSPLGLGWITLDNGREVLGFLAEAEACRDGQDITSFGGWLAYRQSA